MKRKIISIDENKCNGCGVCIPDCPEGALQVIDGKARLVSDLYCDGLGACLKACPQDAMKIEEREAEPYDEYKVMENVAAGGVNVIKAHLKHLKSHGEEAFYAQAIDYLNKNNIEVPDFEDKLPCGCPGTMMKDLRSQKPSTTEETPSVQMNSELTNWPIQLKLLNPAATYLKGADLIIAADCTAFAYANFHKKFLKNKVLTMFCPKLDDEQNIYVDKLAQIFETQDIQSVSIVHMEVPCCGGVESIVRAAMQKVNKNITMKDYTISLQGELV